MSALLIERWTGTETSTEVDLQNYGLAGEGRVRYEPSGWLDLRRILRPDDVGPDDVFADLGSGKGRVVLQAARYPFRRVIGVELSEDLTAIARRNLATIRGRQCEEIELVTADVLEFEIPDDLTVVYLYNPFRGELFGQVLAKLIESVDRAPRPMRVIYRTPVEREQIAATGRFRLERSVGGLRPTRAWSEKLAIHLYSLEPRRRGTTG
jgi:predicted RNA methylase